MSAISNEFKKYVEIMLLLSTSILFAMKFEPYISTFIKDQKISNNENSDNYVKGSLFMLSIITFGIYTIMNHIKKIFVGNRGIEEDNLIVEVMTSSFTQFSLFVFFIVVTFMLKQYPKKET